MTNIIIQGNKETILDNNLLISSTSTNTDILRVDPLTNTVAINKATTATSTLDVEGATAISTTLKVQNKLIVDSIGRVGINVTPSTSYQLHVRGNTYIAGSLQVVGSYVRFDATALDIQDANILLNKDGTDASSSNGGITIDKTSGTAQLVWDNTRQNFRVSLTTGATTTSASLLRVGGNTEGAAFSIGTRDNFAFNIKTNNIERLQVDNQGKTTLTGNTISVAGEATVQGLNIKDFLVPPGTVVAFIPGTFGDSANASFTLILGSANTAASVNSWLASNGYSQWKVCDGTSYNVATSPLYNGANRFTPNLTDSRFLSGTTLSGATGGTNDGSHTHNISSALATINTDHVHTVSSSILVPGGTTPALTSTSCSTGIASPDYTCYSPGTTGASGLGNLNLSHSHGGNCSHSHSCGTLYAFAGYASGTPTGAYIWYGERSAPNWTANRVANGAFPRQDCRGVTLFLTSSDVTGNTSSSGMPIYGANACNQNLSNFSLNHSHTIPNHQHWLCSHAHAFPAHNHGGGSHSHTVSSVAWSNGCCTNQINAQFDHTHAVTAQTGPSSTLQGKENRPLYLTCFYLVRVV